ncbi:MAG TPA: PTS sugar transporter subunit IIA [Hyphomicrobiaceae bacterium]|jgi:PTS system nitrogen regulatory IIA component|nr:PTS sugar transporter subunit IIA [Hyphomicrobiaceae bacterium]
MNIKDFLSAADVAIDVRAADKAALLKELAARAAAAVTLPASLVMSEIGKRDELGSTGIGHGVAIPHARLRDVKKPLALLARLRSPIEFDAVDGQPVDLVFLLLLPASSQLDQLNALAAVARKLRDQDVLGSMRSATSTTELYRAVTEE